MNCKEIRKYKIYRFKFFEMGEFFMANFTRRLPVYLLLDCSGSMYGESIEAVRQGIDTLVNELRGDPQALETAYLSVITFDSTAQQISPLTELMLFKSPKIEANGMTALGGALKVLRECIDREVRKNSPEQKGDWRPLVFILTDGYPTDEEVLNAEVQNIKSLKVANIIACLTGSDAEPSFLKQITDNVLWMNNNSPGDMAKFFAWVSGSIKMSSKSLDAKPGSAFQLPPPPQGFTVVP